MTGPLFGFVQCEWPWQLGPGDGRYLVREENHSGGPAQHVIVLATLGAPERRRLGSRRRARKAQPEPPPTPVATTRVTVIDVREPFQDTAAAQAWLSAAGEAELADGLRVLDRALHVFRIAAADPRLHAPGRGDALIARVGYGEGEQVAEGLWSDALELSPPAAPRRRAVVLAPQARVAALFSGRQQALACEELTLRARLDLDSGRPREASLQLLVALDAAIAELAVDPGARGLSDRLAELREQRAAIGVAAQAALGGSIDEKTTETVTFVLSRLEAALRARAISAG